jgi:hypothetical protein
LGEPPGSCGKKNCRGDRVILDHKV